jgi:hypothetical protein
VILHGSRRQNADRNVDNKGYAHEDSDGARTLLQIKIDYSCHVVAKNLSAFCLCPEVLWKAEFKSDRLINLSKEI